MRDLRLPAIFTITLFFLFFGSLFAQQTEQITGILSKEGLPIGSEEINRQIRSSLSNDPSFWVNFRFFEVGGGSRDSYQCGLTGVKQAALGMWTEEIRINTDDGWGGCILQFAIVDPMRQFPKLKMYVDYQPTATRNKNTNAGQCHPSGKREILPTKLGPDWGSGEIFMNMDGRDGGCALTFEIQNDTDDIELHIQFFPDDDGIYQCPDPTRSDRTPGKPEYHVATKTKPLTIVLDTDGGWGGCRMKFRLARKA